MARRLHQLSLFLAAICIACCNEDPDVSPASLRHAISGRITKGDSGLPGVTVSDGFRSAVSDSSGYFRIIEVTPGDYTLLPMKAGERFSPVSRNIQVRDGNLTGNNFSAELFLAPLSGTISCLGATPSGILIEAYRDNTYMGSAAADPYGTYRIEGLPMGNYSIRPKRGKFLFQPDSILVTLTGGPATDINFSARLDLTKARSCTIEFSGFEAKMRNTILRDSSGIALEAVTKDTVLTLDIRNIMKLPLLTLSSQDCAFGVSTHKTGTTDETREEKLILRLNDSGTGIVSFRYLYRYEFNGGSTFSVLDSIAVTGDAPAASTSDAALFTCAGAAELPGLLEKVDLFHSVRDNSAYPKTSYATSMITGYRMLPSSVLRIRFEF